MSDNRPDALKMTAMEAIQAFKTKLRDGATNFLFTTKEALDAKRRSAYDRLEEVGAQYDTAWANLVRYDDPKLDNADPKDKGKVAQLQRQLAKLSADGDRWGADLKATKARLEGELPADERKALQAHAEQLDGALDDLQVEFDQAQVMLDKYEPLAANMLESFNAIAATYHEAEADYVMLRDHGEEILDAINSVQLAYDMQKTSQNVASTKRINAGDILAGLDQKFAETSAKLNASKQRTAPPPASKAEALRKAESKPNRWK